MILHKNLYKHTGYVVGVTKSLFLTLVALFKGEKFPIYDSNPETCKRRGVLSLNKNSDNSFKCSTCMMCAESCPSKCMTIEATYDEKNHMRQLSSFKVDILRCTLCGRCVEVCPVDAIAMNETKPLPGHVSGPWIYDLVNSEKTP